MKKFLRRCLAAFLLVAMFYGVSYSVQCIVVGRSASGGAAAIERTGTPDQWGSTENDDTHSVTVPADATLAVLIMAGQEDSTNYLSEDVATLTINSVSMTLAYGEDSTTWGMAAIWYLANPSTGSQTLEWDFEGTSADASDYGIQFYLVYYKGVNTSSPIDGTGGEQASDGDATTGSLTADSGDALIAVGMGLDGGTCDITTWTNATEQDQDTFNNAVGAWAIDDNLSGNVTVTVDDSGGACANDGVTIVGVVINKAT